MICLLMTALLAAMPLAEAAKGIDAKPQLAVLQFLYSLDKQDLAWSKDKAEALQDVLVTELSKSGKFTVQRRQATQAATTRNSISTPMNIDRATAVKIGKLLGVKYLLTGSVTEYGVADNSATAAGDGPLPHASARGRHIAIVIKAQLIDTSTGEVISAEEVRAEQPATSVFGVGGGVDDNRVFAKLARDCAQQVSTKLNNVKL